MSTEKEKINTPPLECDGARGMRKFNVTEIIQTKGCYFEIIQVRAVDNTILLKGVAKKLGKEQFKEQNF